ncbi:thiamine-monophosphate kinase, partial [Actinotalea sp. C106]|uniref:thiamine-phosphate kinase n=1 Tax=Actinotalea sp. C106 TaxID=2908644 RepID=UPI0020290CCC
SGAQPGDVVAHSGSLGRSAAGLALLSAGRAEEVGCADLVQGYLRPVSPLATAVSAARAGASAMLDVSDGLLRDAGRIARASGVVIDLVAPGLALARELDALSPAASALGVDPLAWLLTGGEDHGFLATFPSADLPEGFVPVGRVRRGHPTVLVDGGPPPVAGTGWDHFTPGAGPQPLR